MIEALQLIAMYVVTMLAIVGCPRLLFGVMCLVAGYPFLGCFALLAALFALAGT